MKNKIKINFNYKLNICIIFSPSLVKFILTVLLFCPMEK